MFTLENILNYTSVNIQIIGVFIAIIGGLIATKLLNTKIEKDTLKEKLEKLNKEIRFYQKGKITDEKEIGDIFEAKNNDITSSGSLINLTGKKILIVDDNKINIKLASRLLESYHFEIDEALSGS